MSETQTIEDPRKLEIEELYQHMYKQYKASRVEIGKLQRVIDQLRYEREQVQKQLDQLKAADKEMIEKVRKEQMYIQIKKHNAKLEKRITRLRKDNETLIIKLNDNHQD